MNPAGITSLRLSLPGVFLVVGVFGSLASG
jgi:hypothetical protein